MAMASRITRGARAGMLSAVLLALLAIASGVSAGPYDVEGVSVEATARDAVTAKAEAVGEGQARALQIVLQRLTRSADHARLPRVEPQRVEHLVANFSVLAEETGPTRYAASLSFRFEPPSIQKLLADAAIAFTDTQAAPVLVVPIFREGGSRAFTGDNPHLQAWRSYDLDNTLTPIRLPGDDVSAHGIDADDIVAGEADAMSALRYLYRVGNVLVGLCGENPAQGAFVCTLEGSGPLGPLSLQQAFAAGSDPQAAAQAAAGAFLASIEEQWKERNAVLRGAPGGVREGMPIPVRVSFTSLGEWQSLRARLARVPGISDIEIQALHARGALLTIHYSGPGEDLAAVLASEGMVLSNAGDHWVLLPN